MQFPGLFARLREAMLQQANSIFDTPTGRVLAYSNPAGNLMVERCYGERQKLSVEPNDEVDAWSGDWGTLDMGDGIEGPDTYEQWWPEDKDIEALFAQLTTVSPVEFFTPDQKTPRTLIYPLDLCQASEHEIAILYQHVSAKCQNLQATSLHSNEADELRLACYTEDPGVAIFYRCSTNPALLITLILYADGQIAANVFSGTEGPLYELRRDEWEQIVARVRTVEFFVKSYN